MSNAASDPNALDTTNLIPWLEEHVAGFGGYRAITKFGDGQSNPTYGIEAESGRYVLRAKPPGELLKSAHAVDREFRVMSALADTDVPVPKMLALSEEGDESPIGRQFFVMERLDGRILWDPALPELGEGAKANAKRGRIYDSMNKTLAALHAVDPMAAGLETFGRPGNYFARQTDRWAKQYRASEVEHNQQVHDVIAWLEANMPEDDGQVTIVHGDYRLDNMIFAHDSEDVIGVLDWELSTLGHPMGDLSYQCMNWRLPNGDGSRGLMGIDRPAIGLPTEEEYVETYCRRRGISDVGNWSFYVSYNLFRFLAILQGVYKRALDGNASNPERAKQMANAIPLLAAAAMHEIENHG
ncbi:MAG: phosphotransferase [Pseudomonadota bacterium]